MLETDDDLAIYAELDTLHSNEPSTLEIVRDREATFPKEGIKHRFFAEEQGHVLGMVAAYRWPNDRPGVFWANVVVRPGDRGRGVGRDLARHLDEFLEGASASEVRAFVREADEPSNDFARRRGFTLRQHIFESTILLSEFNMADHVAPQPDGVKVVPYADLQAHPDALKNLWELYCRLEADIPGVDAGTERSLEQFELEFTQTYTWDPEGIFVALDVDAWVGLGWVMQLHPGRYYNMLTGVLPTHRGRGIAKALKLTTIALAQQRGGEYIRTNNDSNNAPMLAINRGLGYRPEPGWKIVERKSHEN